MTNYSIQVKKGEIQYSISSGDRAFISNYIEDFFYAIKSVKTTTFETNSLPKLYTEKKPIEQEKTISETKFEKDKNLDDMVKSLFDKSAEDAIENLNQTLKNKTKVEKEDLSNLTNLLEPKHNTNPEKIKINQTDAFDFGSILEDKISNPVYEEVQETQVFNYDEWIKSKKPESLTDYLIITAYYMLENENLEQFQLKQLNAKLFNSMKMVVDRKTVQKAVEDGLLYVVSDGIQNDGAVEYALTQAGQEFYTNAHA